MSIEENRTDRAVSLGKVLIGFAPVAGPLIAEVVGNLIPNQRIDRITEFVRQLEAKVDGMQDRLSAYLENPRFVDLMEDGFVQVSRALSEDRIGYISSLIKNSLSAEELDHVESKRMLGLLGEFIDVEIIVLRSKLYHEDEDPGFYERHREILAIRPVGMGSPQEDLDADAISRSHRQHLTQ
jgi:hypothetical protein